MDSVVRHYDRPGLLARIDEVLCARGVDPSHLTPDDLAPLDQFHIGGKKATLGLARLAQIGPAHRILDIGGGLGGPARFLAQEFGCRVTVVDLTEEFCAVGRELTRRCGLRDKVDFIHASAVSMPVDSASFDFAWSQHSTMNIPDKRSLFTEIRRVLVPGGRYVMHEVFAGGMQPILYPTPWASDESASFVISVDQGRELLEAAGFEELLWEDTTETGASWFEQRIGAQSAGAVPSLGVHLILGETFKPASANMLTNLRKGRTRLVEALLRSPATFSSAP